MVVTGWATTSGDGVVMLTVDSVHSLPKLFSVVCLPRCVAVLGLSPFHLEVCVPFLHFTSVVPSGRCLSYRCRFGWVGMGFWPLEPGLVPNDWEVAVL